MGDRLLQDAAKVLADEALAESLSRFVAGELDAAESEELQRRLRDDPAAQDALILLTLQAESIRQLVGKPESQKPIAPAAAPHAGAKPAPGEASGTAYPIYRKGYEPKPARFRPHHYAITGVAAVLLAACGVAVYLLAFNAPPSDPDPQTPNTAPRPVATLIENTGNLTTPDGFPVEGDDYSAGQYTLSRGTAEFMLTNAVNVKLHGHSRMVMHNDRNVSLKRGRAAFVVPRDAAGFTVRLPGRSKVIDLGTSFEVEVDEANRTRLVVTEGTVAWEAGGDVAVLIEAGQRARLVDGRPVIFAEPQDQLARYVSDLPETMATDWFEPGAARLDQYLDARIATVPPALADLSAIIPPRGENSAPGAAYAFTLKQPARLYLLVHDRGGFISDGWERTEHAVAWTVADQFHTDTVYTRIAERGEVMIPPHTGRDASRLYGVPHVCLVAPIPESVENPTNESVTPQEGSLKGAL